jgi:PAS domain S-box-containing protein
MTDPPEVAALVPVLSAFPTAAAITGHDGVIRWANTQCASLAGAAVEELIGRSIGILVEEHSNSALRSALHSAVTEGAPWMGEAARRPGNGGARELELTVTPIAAASGSVTHALWTLRDSSALKADTERLDQFQKVVSAAELAAHFGVFRWDAKTGSTQWSARTSVLYGLDPATTEPSVEAWLESVHPADRERVLQEFHNSLEPSNVDGSLSLQYRSADGLRWIAGYAQLYRDTAGKPVQMVGINLDITKSKLHELALSHQAEFTRGVFDSTDAHLAVVDADGRILDVNSSWRQFAAENHGEDQRTWGPGSNYFRVCAPAAGGMEFAEEAYEGLRQVQLGRLPRFEIEYPCHSTGQQRWFVVRVLPFLGRPGTVLVSHTDVTERRRMERALRESEERYRGVSSVMSDVAYACRATGAGDCSIEWLTGASERITGYSADELKAMHCWGTLVVEEDRPLFEKQVAGLASGWSGSGEFRLRHKDGSIRWPPPPSASPRPAIPAPGRSSAAWWTSPSANSRKPRSSKSTASFENRR